MKTGKQDDSWMYLDMQDVDLSKYRDMVHKHNIMTPMHYREDLVQHFLSDPNKKGERLP